MDNGLAYVVEKRVLELDNDLPMVIAMEELAELQQAVSKGIRGKLDKDNLTEELADVIICIGWIMRKYNIDNNEIIKWQNFKNERCLERLNNGTFK